MVLGFEFKIPNQNYQSMHVIVIKAAANRNFVLAQWT